jgi:hypothetical protein
MTPTYAYRAARHLTKAKDALLRADDQALEEAISHATSTLAVLFDEKLRREAKPYAIERLVRGEIP